MGNGASVRRIFRWLGRLLFLAIVATLTYFTFFSSETHPAQLRRIQRSFLRVERRTNAELKKFSGQNRNYSPGEALPVRGVAFFYRNDSLVCWNSNQLPVARIADLHFPQAGVIQLQNGWYYVAVKTKGSFKYVVATHLSFNYPYQNAELENKFSPQLGSYFAELVPPNAGVHKLTDASGKAVAAVKFLSATTGNPGHTLVVIGWIIVAVFCWRSLMRMLGNRFAWKISAWLIAAIIAGFAITSITTGDDSVLFDPSVLALSSFLPNLFSVVVGVLLLAALIEICVQKQQASRIFGGSLLLISVAMIVVLQLLVRATVVNSSIPMEIEKLFSLSLLSVLLLLLFAICSLAVFRLVRKLSEVFGQKSYVFLFIAAAVFAADWWFHIYWPFTLILLAAAWICFGVRQPGFSHYLLILLLLSGWTSFSVIRYSQKKELEDRELYANQLAEERDPNVDLEFISAKDKLLSETASRRVILNDSVVTPEELKDILERRVFNGYWERYDIDFFVYNAGDTLTPKNGKRQNEFRDLLALHGERSETDTNLYFILDYTSQYSYVFRLPMGEKILFGTLKSKRIPEEIGFPRLLISDRANVFESLKNYSIAKYYRGKLVSEYGAFPYPMSLGVFVKNRKGKQLHLLDNGYTHLLLNKTRQDTIVLSAEKPDIFDQLTSVAFLLCFFGLLLGMRWLISEGIRTVSFQNVSFAVKIQLLLVGMVFLALVVFSISSSAFVRRQYIQYTADQVREKIHSVNTVARFRLGSLDSITQPLRTNDLAYHLRNWSHIFVTDVNVYNPQGHLVRSSQPKIYNYGLIGEQLNPKAARALIVGQKSEYIHSEHIGNLRYLSAYAPLLNDRGKLLGYINLQHFDQQNAFETQIVKLISSIINVFLILLVISLVVTFAASSWITLPLRNIRARLAEMQLGKYNQPLNIPGNDEIGQLVQAYNAKLVELELAAEKLAVSERESAWREMAKQVAHEIKNPLTPMKLSLQQLLRVYDPNDPDGAERLKRVANSLLEQIDTLAAIANSFSSFASLPEPKNVPVNLNALLHDLVTLFEGQAVKIHSELGEREVIVYGDADMLGRVFLNLVKNAEQAIQSAGKGEIYVRLHAGENEAVVSVTDTGSGIDDDLRSRIFEPYFTTKSSGTGLGLALVKQIVESHEGKLVLREGYPTTFEVSLPLFQ